MRGTGQFAVCANSFRIRDKLGTWNDVVDLVDASVRNLEAVEEVSKVVQGLAEVCADVCVHASLACSLTLIRSPVRGRRLGRRGPRRWLWGDPSIAACLVLLALQTYSEHDKLYAERSKAVGELRERAGAVAAQAVDYVRASAKAAALLERLSR